jgi:hypothetical protein
LKPLHDTLSRILRNLETDGTFHQERPFDLLIKRVEPGRTFHCFDLSSATDRLPLELQRDIINHFNPYLGTC